MKNGMAAARFVMAGAGKCAWRWGKNCAKTLVGREATFDEDGLFWRQFVLHVMGIRRIRKITCTGLPGEGAGSQALMVMNAMNFARAFGLEYLHMPFRVVHHATRPMEEWAAAWEKFFNLGEGERPCGSERSESANFCYCFMALDLYFGWRERVEELAERFREMMPEVRRKYRKGRERREAEELTVAVHVRRGADAPPEDPEYYTANETILRTMRGVREELEALGAKYSMRVYAHGGIAGLEELAQPGVDFFVDADAVWTLGEMANADVLILGKGCYSYCAGLLSEGIKIFEGGKLEGNEYLPGSKWQYVAMDDSWIVSESDGRFEREALRRAVERVMGEKVGSALRIGEQQSARNGGREGSKASSS